MSWDRPLRHDVVVERLFRAAADGRLPHALAFEGPEGIGKFRAAGWLATGLLCAGGPGPPCGTCGPCKRVATGNHPDLFVVDAAAEGEERIKIGRIAQRGESEVGPEGCLEAFLDLRAMEGERRCVLIREAHRMNDAAQNALLKTLEEPRPGVLLVLETHLAVRLLPTILSRCVRVGFGPLSRDEATRVLEGEGLEAVEAGRLARWAEGAPGRALAWRRRGAAAALELLGACVDGRRSPTALLPELLELEGEFPGATPGAVARERARFLVDLALALVADGRRLGAGLGEEELGLGPEAGALKDGGGPGGRRALARLLECRADVDRNLAPEAVLERALLALAERGRIMSAGRGAR